MTWDCIILMIFENELKAAVFFRKIILAMDVGRGMNVHFGRILMCLSRILALNANTKSSLLVLYDQKFATKMRIDRDTDDMMRSITGLLISFSSNESSIALENNREILGTPGYDQLMMFVESGHILYCDTNDRSRD